MLRSFPHEILFLPLFGVKKNVTKTPTKIPVFQKLFFPEKGGISESKRGETGIQQTNPKRGVLDIFPRLGFMISRSLSWKKDPFFSKGYRGGIFFLIKGPLTGVIPHSPGWSFFPQKKWCSPWEFEIFPLKQIIHCFSLNLFPLLWGLMDGVGWPQISKPMSLGGFPPKLGKNGESYGENLVEKLGLTTPWDLGRAERKFSPFLEITFPGLDNL